MNIVRETDLRARLNRELDQARQERRSAQTDLAVLIERATLARDELRAAKKCLQTGGTLLGFAEGLQRLAQDAQKLEAKIADANRRYDAFSAICGAIDAPENLWCPFATDSEHGEVAAEDWDDARRWLDQLIDASDGGWGWVEHPATKERYEKGQR